MKAPLAIVTMVYNEPEFLPVWCRHYPRQTAPEHCYVIDHGSDDGSTESLGAINRVRIPRSPQDDETRSTFISHFCESLLSWYDSVIYVDCDEILLPDPDIANSLQDFANTNTAPIVTATGLDIIHTPATEPPLDWSHPITIQRTHLRFSSAMCKPVLIRQPVHWVPGFHCTAEPSEFGAPLFLFHLRYVDLESGLTRLARTREQPWINETLGAHQRMRNQDWAGMLAGMAGLPINPAITLSPSDPQLSEWRNKVRASMKNREHERYTLDLHISGDTLWLLPERFQGSF